MVIVPDKVLLFFITLISRRLTVREKIKTMVADVVDNMQEDDYATLWGLACDIATVIVEATPTKFDDMLVKPLIRMLRGRYGKKDLIE